MYIDKTKKKGHEFKREQGYMGGLERGEGRENDIIIL